jgi:hypothetical protein
LRLLTTRVAIAAAALSAVLAASAVVPGLSPRAAAATPASATALSSSSVAGVGPRPAEGLLHLDHFDDLQRLASAAASPSSNSSSDAAASSLRRADGQTRTDGASARTKVQGAVVTSSGVSYQVPGDIAAVPVPRPAVAVTPPPPPPAPPAVDPASAQAFAASQLTSHGWDSGQMGCLVDLWNRESGWRYNADNSSSGAYGIPQALPGSKMATIGGDWQTNPQTQIIWGLDYIARSYGSPCGAWAHETSAGWY